MTQVRSQTQLTGREFRSKKQRKGKREQFPNQGTGKKKWQFDTEVKAL